MKGSHEGPSGSLSMLRNKRAPGFRPAETYRGYAWSARSLPADGSSDGQTYSFGINKSGEGTFN